MSKEGSAHKRAPSLDAALHRLRLSEDTFYSANASADQEGPPVAPPSSAEHPASRFAQEPTASTSAASEGAAELPEEEEEEDEQQGTEDGADDLEGAVHVLGNMTFFVALA